MRTVACSKVPYAKLTEQGRAFIAYFVQLAGRYAEPGTYIYDGSRPTGCNNDCNSQL